MLDNRHRARLSGILKSGRAKFDIPDAMMRTIKNTVENYFENDNAYHHFEEIYYNKGTWDYRPADDACTHLLDFAHNTEDGRYVFVSGFAGIYYMAFGDSAIDVLHRLYKNLSGYEMKGMKKDKAILFDYVEEDIVQVVIDNGDAEQSILGAEDYGSYVKFVTVRGNG